MIQGSHRRMILILSEDQNLLEQMSEPLSIEGYDVRSASSIEEAQYLFKKIKPDLIILNPEFSSVQSEICFSHFYATLNNCSVIIVSKPTESEKMIQHLDLGANDFISSPFVPVELLARVRTQFRIQDMRDLLLEVNEKLQALVEIDDLTGLYNMRSLYQKLDFEIERTKRFNRPVTVVMMDIDKFKSVNDSHDHLFGSYVISEIGKIVRQATRAVDIPARYGGDEFLIVLSEIPQAGVEFFCERLRQRIEQTHFIQEPDQIKLTMSIGFATYNNEGPMSAKELIRQADAALYESKRQGRNRVTMYNKELDRLYDSKRFIDKNLEEQKEAESAQSEEKFKKRKTA